MYCHIQNFKKMSRVYERKTFEQIKNVHHKSNSYLPNFHFLDSFENLNKICQKVDPV